MEKMDEDDVQSTFAAMVDQARTFADTEVGAERELASLYYNGAPFGDEVAGRSQVVSRDVRDTVQQMLPSLMKIFFGSERVIEFEPQGPEDVAVADQATDYVNYIITRDNPGFQIMYSAFKDALVRKTGIFKTWFEETESVTGAEYTGLDPNTAMMLLSEDGVEEVSQEVAENGTLSLSIKRRIKLQRIRVAVVPPEEFIINDAARNECDATIIGNICRKTRSDLIAMGISEDILEDAGSGIDEMETNAEILARRNRMTLVEDHEDKATEPFEYIEAYVRIDQDGDGIAELRRICAVGTQRTIVSNEVWDEPGFAIICPDPEYYTVFGQSVADNLLDIQRVKSSLIRSMLDNLALTNFPRMGYVEGQVHVDDLMNTEIGALIRMKSVGSVTPIETPFVAGQSFGMLEYFDAIKEQRTGISKASVGLEADALQSTAAGAANAMVAASRDRVELIARIFAETGVKRLYRLILKLVCKHQDQARVIRLRNQFVPMDPRAWNADMDLNVNVGLGGGTQEEKLIKLNLIAQKQEQILGQLGPSNPLLTLQQYYNTLTKQVELAGFKDTTSYFTDPARYQAPPPQPLPPDPGLMIAQIEQQKVQEKAAADLRSDQIKAQTEQAKIELQRAEAIEQAQLDRARLELDREKAAIDLQIAQANLEAKRIEMMIRLSENQRKEAEAQFKFAQQQMDQLQPEVMIAIEPEDERS